MNFKLLILCVTFAGMITQVKSTAYSNGCSIYQINHYLNLYRNDPILAANRIQAIWIDNMVQYTNSQGVDYGVALFSPKMILYSQTVTWFTAAKNWLLNTAVACPASQNYTLNEGWTRAAREHSEYQIGINSMTHYGPTNSTTWKVRDRAKIYNTRGSGSFSWKENIANCVPSYANSGTAGTWTAEEFMVLSWIVDHNVASLGHRYNIYSCDNNESGLGLFPYTKSNGALADRVTHMMIKGAYSANGYPFTTAKRDEICWTNWLANSSTCDPANL